MATDAQDADLRNVIENYYWHGYPYKDIVYLLNVHHDVKMSVSTLLRRLNKYGLFRREQEANSHDIQCAIQHELSGSGRCCGYRALCHRLKSSYHLQVRHESIRLMLRQMDPISVTNRRQHRLHRRTYHSHGPNDTWHVDGYDKLSRYGFCISGCIDGYSRMLIWLQCASTNHDPAVIAGYYVTAVRNFGCCPSKVRTDCGTENVNLCTLQCFLSGSIDGHIYGSSPANQRIEAWWSYLRHSMAQWWIDLFEDIMLFGAFRVGNAHDMDCLRFCFMSLVRRDLQEVLDLWNTHRIRPSHGAVCPAGVPNMLYYRPSPPAVECGLRIPADFGTANTFDDIITEATVCSDADYEDYLSYLLTEKGWDRPQTIDDALRLYFDLTSLIRSIQ